MGADHDVDLARSEAFFDLGDLTGRHEARDLLDPKRQTGEALAHHLVVLANQKRGRGQDRDLPRGYRDDERGAQRHLGLAEADIAADQPVHRPTGRQIVEHGLDRPLLILGLLVGEAGGELLVQPGRRQQRRRFAQAPLGGHLDQFARDLADPLLDPRLAASASRARQACPAARRRRPHHSAKARPDSRPARTACRRPGRSDGGSRAAHRRDRG